jgi:HSP20 family protein
MLQFFRLAQGRNQTIKQKGEVPEMLYRTSPTAPVFGLRREIDRLFEDTFGRGDGGTAWTPAVDIQENQNELRLDVELPGLDPDEVEITAENGVLTIKGEKQLERKEGDDSRYHVVERAYGNFIRSFQLPQGLDEGRIEATFNNGILSVHIPKSAIPQPKKIQIKSGTMGEIGAGGQRQMSSGGTQQKRTVGTGTGAQTQTPMAASGSQGSSAKSGGRSKTEPNT